MSLLPNANQQFYSTWVANNSNDLGFINGLWNAILCTKYSTSNMVYTVNPGGTVTNGTAALLVTRNQTDDGSAMDEWSVIYESRTESSPDTFPDILTQLQAHSAELPNGRAVFLIAAKGTGAMFWLNNKDDFGNFELMGISVNRDSYPPSVVHGPNSTAELFDVVDDQDSINSILNFFVQGR